MTLIYGADREIREWISEHLFGEKDGFDEKSTCIGVVNGGQLICGILYNNYIPDVNIEMSIASVDKRWATRHNLRAFFKYPFIDLGVKRVSTLCSASKGDIVRFNERIGFKQEGFHRQAWPMGGDAVSFGMLKNECRWLNG